MKLGDKPTKDELVELEGIDPCRHARRLWCLECVDDTYKLHTVLGKIDGLEGALDVVTTKAGAAFIAGKDDQAKLYRDLANAFRQAVETLKIGADRIRREQGIIS